jgi:hypothetical protein
VICEQVFDATGLIKSLISETSATLVEQITARQGEETHMADAQRCELLFRKSRRCTGGGCMEVALLPTGGAVVRHSTDSTRKLLTFSKQEWFCFVSCVKTDGFDL